MICTTIVPNTHAHTVTQAKHKIEFRNHKFHFMRELFSFKFYFVWYTHVQRVFSEQLEPYTRVICTLKAIAQKRNIKIHLNSNKNSAEVAFDLKEDRHWWKMKTDWAKRNKKTFWHFFLLNHLDEFHINSHATHFQVCLFNRFVITLNLLTESPAAECNKKKCMAYWYCRLPVC